MQWNEVCRGETKQYHKCWQNAVPSSMQRQTVRLGVLREDVFVCVSVEQSVYWLVNPNSCVASSRLGECGRSHCASKTGCLPEIKLRGGTADGVSEPTVFGAISLR
jgi:hypothetical protein